MSREHTLNHWNPFRLLRPTVWLRFGLSWWKFSECFHCSTKECLQMSVRSLGWFICLRLCVCVYIYQYVYNMRIYLQWKITQPWKEWNIAMCCHRDGPRDFQTMGSKPDREIHIWHHLMRNLKNNTNESIYKTEADSYRIQINSYQRGKGGLIGTKGLIPLVNHMWLTYMHYYIKQMNKKNLLHSIEITYNILQ